MFDMSVWTEHEDPRGRKFLYHPGGETKWLWQRWEHAGEMFCRNVRTGERVWVSEMDPKTRRDAGFPRKEVTMPMPMPMNSNSNANSVYATQSAQVNGGMMHNGFQASNGAINDRSAYAAGNNMNVVDPRYQGAGHAKGWLGAPGDHYGAMNGASRSQQHSVLQNGTHAGVLPSNEGLSASKYLHSVVQGRAGGLRSSNESGQNGGLLDPRGPHQRPGMNRRFTSIYKDNEVSKQPVSTGLKRGKGLLSSYEDHEKASLREAAPLGGSKKRTRDGEKDNEFVSKRQKSDPDQQYFCKPCDRNFKDWQAISQHRATKSHGRSEKEYKKRKSHTLDKYGNPIQAAPLIEWMKINPRYEDLVIRSHAGWEDWAQRSIDNLPKGDRRAFACVRAQVIVKYCEAVENGTLDDEEWHSYPPASGKKFPSGKYTPGPNEFTEYPIPTSTKPRSSKKGLVSNNDDFIPVGGDDTSSPEHHHRKSRFAKAKLSPAPPSIRRVTPISVDTAELKLVKKSKYQAKSLNAISFLEHHAHLRGTRASHLALCAHYNQEFSSFDPDESESADETFLGTCTTVEKEFLRLTSAPKESEVRPLHILQKSLQNVKEKWKTRVKDYDWVCRQMKSIRQDLKVQHVETLFTANVYETHARIALEQTDLGEFNTCVAQVMTLFSKDGLEEDELIVDEFWCYRILYDTLFATSSYELAKLLKQLSLKERSRVATSYALQVTMAVQSFDWVQFLKLYDTPPAKTMAAYLMELLFTRVRSQSLAIICSAFGPTKLPLSEVMKTFRWEEDEGASCRRFLDKINVVVDKNYIDCKQSKQKGISVLRDTVRITHAGT